MKALLRKDFLCFYRSEGVIFAALLLAIEIVILSGFGFRKLGVTEQELLDMSPGVNWLAILFCSLGVLNHTFYVEKKSGAIDAMFLSSYSASSLFLSKYISNFIILLLLGIFIFFCSSLFFYSLGVLEIFKLIALLALVLVGYSALATLVSVLVSIFSAKEFLMPLLLFPLIMPLFAAAIYCSRLVLVGEPFVESNFWFSFIVLFDIILVALSFYLFEFLLEE